MAKSKMSCFKIMTCGGSGRDEEDVEKHQHFAPDENTTPSDKPRWSFRKRSTRHRVLSNTVISEPVDVIYSQENRQIVVDNFQSPKTSSCTEKTSIQEKTDENSLILSTVKNEEVYTSVISSKPSVHDSDAVVIQAHIRGYLARKEYRRTKSAIKLQAAVRGHLVRRKAAGTLRCVQAIIKMQALVRARYAHQSVEGLSSLEAKEKSGKESTSSPLEKLLSNEFARQLLVSSKTKPIVLKCQPSKSDSTWKWMERWMAVTSSNFSQKNEKVNINESHKEIEECIKLVDLSAENEVISKVSFTVKSEPLVQEDTESYSMSENVSGPGDQEPETNLENSLDSSPNHAAKILFENEVVGAIDKNAKPELPNENDIETQSEYHHLQSESPQKPALYSSFDKPCINSEDCTKEEASEPVSNEGNAHVFGRKSCNPAFAAVKSKFEELSSSSTVSKIIGSYQEAASKQKIDSQKALVDSLNTGKETGLTGSPKFYNPGGQVAASECGTEISISSTLDSPDRSETDGGEIVLEIGALDNDNHVSSASVEVTNLTNRDTDEEISRIEPDPAPPKEHEKSNMHLASFVSGEEVQSPENVTQSITSVMPTSRESAADETVKSPEGTPRSQVAVPDLHGTPSSQVSLDTNTSKKDAGVPIQKKKKQITRNSSSSPSKGSGERTSIEQLSKEAKHAKRRHSFGLSKPDQVDKELKTPNNSTLPSYMQATASARAKTHANPSPKLSPDVQETSGRKRHSLPIENGKQSSSPRMLRSASQVQQKANGTHSPQSLSTERRWQR